MLKDRKHYYRLATRPPSFFRETLEKALCRAPRIYEQGEGPPGRQAAKRTFELALFDEAKDPFYFTLSILREAGEPDENDMSLVGTVFDELIRMDDAARAIPCQYDENEELFEVEIDLDQRQVVFRYSSTLWNTEWTVHFRSDESGAWVCLGIPDWQSPGRYII
ncbi:MAG: hypothetical protein V2I74_02705 [Erythrobacter sp.]|jgi:hypothetical protein|nr:hypothetical protein [Erythrobacter sp.]